MSREPLVPDDFDVPRELCAAQFRLEPLGPQHNAADLAAWMSSIEHIQATPGFEEHGWPPDDGYTAEANLADLVRHAEEFEQRVGFAYTVMRPETADIIGCVYVDPGARPGSVAVRSWVTADASELDAVLRQAIREWLAKSWPFDEVVYAG